MTTIKIELPETLSQKLVDQGISPDQLNEAATRLVLSYIQQQLLSPDEAPVPEFSAGESKLRSAASAQKPPTLLDRRGTIPVSAPQDFDTIRKQVRAVQARQNARD